MKTEAARFGFGKNWSDFIKKAFSEERVAASREKLLGFMRLPDLGDRTFLDIGCGSGLHSLAALRAGAKRVVSFDYDPDSVATARYLWEREGRPPHWQISQGSVLDQAFMRALPPSDIVYSWGVLHHTGDVWTAIANAALPLHAESLFFIALYSYDIQLDPTAEFWLDVKQRYNRKGLLGRTAMELWYFWKFIYLPDRRAGQSTFRRFREYYKSRGMSQWTDIRDWLGGWPMEFVKILEVQAFLDKKLGLELLDLTSNEANAEYLCRKQGAQVWDDRLRERQGVELQPPFTHVKGHCWRAALPDWTALADSEAAPRRSPVFVTEGDRRLQIPHAAHWLISGKGLGRYAHWGDGVLFAATDNSDPNTNGRTYRAQYYPGAGPA
jgi:SAM-dependent methyltransferase